jgi:hypothetical protein
MMRTISQAANDPEYEIRFNPELWGNPEFKQWALRCAMTMANIRPSSFEKVVLPLCLAKPTAWTQELQKVMIVGNERKLQRTCMRDAC